MLSLKAVAWEDGYAVVEEDSALFLIRPPYRRENKYSVRLGGLETAISKYGFSEAAGVFEDWASLIEHIKGKLLEIRKADGEPNTNRIQKLIERAPAATVSVYLDRVQHELLIDRKWHAAVGVLTHLLRNPVVKSDSSLLDRVSELLAFAEDGRSREAISIEGLSEPKNSVEQEFPLIKDLYGPEILALGERIKKEGRVLCMGSGTAA